MTECGHRLCALIGGGCSVATGRSRGCTPGLRSKEIAPETVDEVGTLIVAVESGADDERVRAAAIRLAAIVRREAREDRILLAHLRREEPELATALERLIVRQRQESG